MEPEVVSFTVPKESNKVVFVWNISAQLSEGETYWSLMKAFSPFGPLYSLKLFPNAGVADPGYYAVVRYFTSGSAKKAHAACDRKSLFQDSPLKVQVCNRKKSLQFKSLELYGYKCQELANYYLGFNGWSKRVIALQNISGLDVEAEEEASPQEPARLRYLCVVEVTIHDGEIRSRGVGVAEEAMEKQNDPTEFLSKNGKVQKYAVQKALSNAFKKILLVVFDNGKVAVEYVPDEDDAVDCLTEEELQGFIQVNDFTWASVDGGAEDDEEMLANLTFYEDTAADGE
ncbi:PREDICTED: RAD52 motif-containing protein 1 [Nanorana parkeri]|uniref:RAD52 motif-containing protein 1 n=1 Tax=Nanorana parkeri TaxID=125878 RepID=UPI0008547564|nr:PREDICTED: RAD52 motif-containing protein 1 [Nanorana parkeri]